jgi:hypothetical protein
MDPKQMKDIQKAQQQMAKLEEQLKSMPEAQRDMIEKRLRPQMETMKKMASEEGMEVEVQVHEIRVNAGLPSQLEMGQKVLELGSESELANP